MLKGASQWWTLAAFVVACFLPSVVGSFWAAGRSDWYHLLKKPAFTPPAWVFGPVWSALYLLMGVAAWLVWSKVGFRWPLLVFVIQLALNGLWTPLFFGLHNLPLAFVELILLWLAVLASTAAFFRSFGPAGWLMAPYLAWVSFAVVLNGSIWWLNRP